MNSARCMYILLSEYNLFHINFFYNPLYIKCEGIGPKDLPTTGLVCGFMSLVLGILVLLGLDTSKKCLNSFG